MIKKQELKFHSGRIGSAIAVRVAPRASKNEITEVMQDGTIKIKLTSPPVEGKANQALVEFLSELLEVSQSRIEIVSGISGRKKLIAIEGLDAETVHKKIIEKIG